MSTRLDLANAQLLGYFAGKWGNLIGMVEGMDLKKSEWIKIKKDYEPYLDDEDIKEIDNYFGL